MILRSVSRLRLSSSSPCISDPMEVISDPALRSSDQLTPECMNVTDHTGISKFVSILSLTKTSYTSSGASANAKQTVSPVAKARYAQRE